MQTQTPTPTPIKKLTITLTGRPPVRIDEADWPVIASATYSAHDGPIECRANRRWSGAIRVRQHADGRAIVYATASYDSQWQGERDYSLRGGELLPAGSDLADAISRVHASLEEAGVDRGRGWDALAADCIADLPAEDL